jgi:UDP-glucose 4-epimerase
VNQLVELLGNDSGLVNIPKRPGEPDCTQADISRIRSQLGWSPKVELEEGVGVLLENVERWRSAPVWDEESIGEATRDWFKFLS